MPAGKPLTDDLKKSILKYYGDGVTLADTAELLGISKYAVYRTWVKYRGRRKNKTQGGEYGKKRELE